MGPKPNKQISMDDDANYHLFFTNRSLFTKHAVLEHFYWFYFLFIVTSLNYVIFPEEGSTS